MKKLFTFALLLFLVACSNSPSSSGGNIDPLDPNAVIDSTGAVIGTLNTDNTNQNYIFINSPKGYLYAIDRNNQSYYYFSSYLFSSFVNSPPHCNKLYFLL